MYVYESITNTIKLFNCKLHNSSHSSKRQHGPQCSHTTASVSTDLSALGVQRVEEGGGGGLGVGLHVRLRRAERRVVGEVSVFVHVAQADALGQLTVAPYTAQQLLPAIGACVIACHHVTYVATLASSCYNNRT